MMQCATCRVQKRAWLTCALQGGGASKDGCFKHCHARKQKIKQSCSEKNDTLDMLADMSELSGGKGCVSQQHDFVYSCHSPCSTVQGSVPPVRVQAGTTDRLL